MWTRRALSTSCSSDSANDFIGGFYPRDEWPPLGDAAEKFSQIESQTVTDARLSLQVPGASRVALQLPAQLCDIDAQVLRLLGVLRPPYFVEQLSLRHHPAGVLDQHLK